MIVTFLYYVFDVIGKIILFPETYYCLPLSRFLVSEFKDWGEA